MTPENFCYWLKGYFELTSENKTLTSAQVELIKSHLEVVFIKTTPSLEEIEKKTVDTLAYDGTAFKRGLLHDTVIKC